LDRLKAADTVTAAIRIMSFRSRLTTFFVLIVVVPMTAVGVLVFALIDDSQTGKAEARADGIATVAATVYEDASMQASLDARTVARDLARAPVSKLKSRAAALGAQAGLARVTVQVGSTRLVDVGDRTAIAPGIAVVTASGGRPARTVAVSELTAAQYGHQLAGPGIQVVVRAGSVTLATTLAAAGKLALPGPQANLTIGAGSYQVVTQGFAGFHDTRIEVSILSSLSSTAGSLGSARLLAALFIAGFLVLAFFFSLLASRALHGQLTRFLEAARRLGGGDFSAQIQTSGRDEFAALATEFNDMSMQLARRLDELEQERSRVRKSIRRIGEAFASGLDRDALLELALRTAMDATQAVRGRVSGRVGTADPLTEVIHIGRLAGLQAPIHEVERLALEGDGIGLASADGLHLASVALGSIVPGGPSYGLITVCRDGRRFTDDDCELLRSLAGRATLALANVNLHFDIQRQAITDDLTGLATHGHFQTLLGAEMEEVRRYHYPVGLIMLDLDDFKSVNDDHGHQQGDLVLRYVAEAILETSREVDAAARYGGEEMALILPHTDLEGTYEMAERLRAAIGAIVVPALGGLGSIQITASVGAAASSQGSKNDLIAAADNALYKAKHEGKNRTVKAEPETANVFGGE
jgi:diguanylate cyclase (GGDEF)-like protein